MTIGDHQQPASPDRETGPLPASASDAFLEPPPPVREAPPPVIPASDRRKPATPVAFAAHARTPIRRHPEFSAKRGWKNRFFNKLTSMPAILVFATLILPGLVLGMRNTIVEKMPVAGKLYAAIGLPVNLDGLDLKNVTSVVRKDGGSRHLLVQGEIVNLRKRNGALPNLQLAVRDLEGRTVYSWQAPSPQKKIAAHQSIRFQARLDAPPEDASQVLVKFAR